MNKLWLGAYKEGVFQAPLTAAWPFLLPRPSAAAEKEARRVRLVAAALESADKENQRMLSRKVGRRPAL